MTDVKWKLVPVEPTEEMLKANAGTSTCHPPSWNRAMWAAFLAAAPSPSPEALPASGAVDLLRECLDIMNGLAKDVDACGWLADDLHGPSICTRLRTQLCGCECDACSTGAQHASDCALHNGPALPSGPCDCGAALAKPASEPAGGGVTRAAEALFDADNRNKAGPAPVSFCEQPAEVQRRYLRLAEVAEAALSSPASSSPAEWVKFGPSEDGIKAKAKRQARLEAEALPAGVEALREALDDYHSAYSDYRMSPDDSWERGFASQKMEEAYDKAKALFRALSSAPAQAIWDVWEKLPAVVAALEPHDER